jgi:hypothetical protein
MTDSRLLMMDIFLKMKKQEKENFNPFLDKNFSTNNFASVLGLETISEAFFLCIYKLLLGITLFHQR